MTTSYNSQLARLCVVSALILAFGNSALAQTYTPTGSAGANWSTGTNWSATPVSGTSTALIFAGTTAAGAGYASDISNDDDAAGFQVGTITLAGAGSTAGVASVLTIQGNQLNLSSGGTINLNATAGTKGLTYNLNNAILLSGNANIAGTGSATFNIGGIISDGSGGFGITKTGTSKVTLSGANSYTGATIINGGTIKISAANNLGNNTSATNTITLGGGTLESTSGTYNLGTNRTVTVNGSGTILADTAASTLTVDGNVQGGAAGTNTLTVNANTGNVIISGNIIDGTGSTALIKSSTGTLTLTGTSNAYSGGTSITGGVLNVGSAGALGTTGTISMTGGTLQYSAANTTDYSSRFSTAASQTFKIDNGGQTVAVGSNITTSTDAFTSLGAGTTTLGGANSYAGLTTLTAGTLDVTGTNSSAGNTTSGGTLLLDNASNGGLASGTLTISGGIVQAANAARTLSNNTLLTGSSTISGSQSLTINGTVTNSGGSRTLTSSITGGNTLALGTVYLSEAQGTARSFTVSGVGNTTINSIQDSAAGNSTAGGNTFIVNQTAGMGTLTLANADNYTGTTTLTSGTLSLGNKAVFGTSAVAWSAVSTSASTDLSGANKITNNGTLTGSSTFTGSNNIELGGTFTATGSRTITNNIATATGTLTLSGSTIGLSSSATTNTLTFAGSGNTMVSAVLQNNGTGGTATAGNLAYTGGGKLTLANTNTYTGTTAVSNGTLALTGAGAISSGSTITVSSTGNLTTSGSGTITGATTSLTDTGGTVTLSTANTYGGNTTINGTNALLQIGASSSPTVGTPTSGAIGTGTLILGTANLQAVGGAQTLANNITFNNAANYTISGSNNLTLNGNLSWNGSQTMTVTNSGTTTFGGTLSLRNDASLAQRSFTLSGTGNVNLNGSIVNGSSGNGIVVINDTGTTTLNGNNSYSGSTTIGDATHNSTVILGNANALGYGGVSTVNSSTTVNSGSTLDLNGQVGINEPITLNGTGIGGNGALINSNTGTAAVISNGFAALGIATAGTGYTDGTYSLMFSGGGGTGAAGTATIVGGVVTSVQVTSSGSGYTSNPTASLPGTAGTPTTVAAFNTSASSINLNTTSSIGGAGDITVNAYVSGGGGLTKVGAGTLNLSSTNTYTGATNVSAGTLIDNGSLTSSVAVAGGATFGGSGSTTGTISGAGSVGGVVPVGSILTASAVDPSGGLTFNLGFTQTGAPDWSTATNSLNDVINLTSATPFTTALGSGNNINVYLASDMAGQSFEGGFFITGTSDNDTLSAELTNATFNFYVADAGGSTSYDGSNYSALMPGAVTASTIFINSANFASGTIPGWTEDFTIAGPATPEPASWVLGLIVMALFGVMVRRMKVA